MTSDRRSTSMKRVGRWVVSLCTLAVVYLAISMFVYDYDEPDYEEYGSYVIDDYTFDGHAYSTRVSRQEFSSYRAGTITRLFHGYEIEYRAYWRCEPVFRPAAFLVRKLKRHPFQVEEHTFQMDGEPIPKRCSRDFKVDIISY